MLAAIQLSQFFNELAKYDKRINFGTIRVLVAIMAEDTLSTPQLRRRFPEYGQSAIFRYLDELTTKGYDGKPGFGLVRRVAVEKRGHVPENVYGLTAKGKKLRDRLR